MHNALRVLRRDLGRFARAPLVWAILGGIVVVPSLYAWVNIIAFWNPYATEATRNVDVGIVNLDEGASSKLTGALNVGDQVVAQLKQNHELGWQFLGREEAMDAVRSGSSYAAIVIPPDFSKNLLSVTTPRFVRPTLEYYVNEKANPIGPEDHRRRRVDPPDAGQRHLRVDRCRCARPSAASIRLTTGGALPCCCCSPGSRSPWARC